MAGKTKYMIAVVVALCAITGCKHKDNGTANSQSTITQAIDTSSPSMSSSTETDIGVADTNTSSPTVITDGLDKSTSAPATNTSATSKNTSTSAKNTRGPESTTSAQVSYIGEPAIIYKTKADYSKYVPVILNAEKTEVISYPAPTDVYRNGKLAYPTQLVNGYYLDNRGIGINSAFLNITYDEYVKLKEAPLLADMIGKLMLEKNPFTEIYSIGTRSRFTNEQAEINEIIKKGGLKKFKRLK